MRCISTINTNGSGMFFQDRFKSESIEDERHLLAALRYIHNNPVKAGMVEKPEQSAWSSYRWYFNIVAPQAQLVDAGYVLRIISRDPKRAIKEFKRFANERILELFLTIIVKELRER